MEFKKFLTEEEVMSIVKVSINSMNEDQYELGIKYNYMTGQQTFFRSLFILCVKDYNNLSEEEGNIAYKNYYDTGALITMKNQVINADYAYQMFEKIYNQLNSLENVIDNNLQDLLKIVSEKIPDKKTLTKLVTKLPKEWQNVVNKHDEIVNNTKTETDLTLKDIQDEK